VCEVLLTREGVDDVENVLPGRHVSVGWCRPTSSPLTGTACVLQGSLILPQQSAIGMLSMLNHELLQVFYNLEKTSSPNDRKFFTTFHHYCRLGHHKRSITAGFVSNQR
jgi:hypothetical protein